MFPSSPGKLIHCAFQSAELSRPMAKEAGALSLRDFKVGADLIDTLSKGPGYELEQGNMTIDRIEVREYDAVSD